MQAAADDSPTGRDLAHHLAAIARLQTNHRQAREPALAVVVIDVMRHNADVVNRLRWSPDQRQQHRRVTVEFRTRATGSDDLRPAVRATHPVPYRAPLHRVCFGYEPGAINVHPRAREPGNAADADGIRRSRVTNTPKRDAEMLQDVRR